MRAWKLWHGPEPERIFAQEHRPGERLRLDWIHAGELEVRIGGQCFEHRFVHVVLPFSNWEWARVCRSESFLSLKIGLQSALHELGGAPGICQSDQSSTATHQKGKGRQGREFNERYPGLLAHYGMRAGVIGVGEPQQNGDVESAHHHLRSALDQALKMRGSREFGSVEDFEEFVREVLRMRNAGRAAKLAVEAPSLHALPATRLPEYEEIECVEAALEEEGSRATLDGMRARLGIRCKVIEIDFAADLCAYDALIGAAAWEDTEVAP